MTMQIKSLYLYNFKGEIRVLTFRLGHVNIITGRSATGKSSIISIIEYCLGRSTYNVPDSKYFDAVSWFAVHYVLDSSELLIAKPRPNAGVQSQNGVFFRMGVDISPPEYSELAINTNDASLTQELSRLIGFSPNIHEPDEGQTREPLEANFRHTRFYLFQKQNVIANQELLFHRQSEDFIPQAMKDTLPYLLGAVREDRLKLINEWRQAKRRLSAAQRQLREIEAIISNRIIRGRNLLEEARQVGLIELGNEERINEELVISELRKTQSWRPEVLPGSDSDRAATLSDRLYALQEESREKLRQIRAAEAFENNANGYSTEAGEQQVRLLSIGLYKDDPNDQDKCPICSADVGQSVATTSAIQKSLERLSRGLHNVETQQPRLREHIDGLTRERETIRESIEEVRSSLIALYAEEESAKQHRDQNVRIARIVGRISLYLESITQIDEDHELRSRVDELKDEVGRLEELLDPNNIEEALQSISSQLTMWMSEMARELGLEHSEYPYRLDIRRLTVLADRPLRPIPLIRMGSGENWLGCHVISHLALHRHFVEETRPVPGFLVLDQPSQVYFPSENDYKALEGRIEDLHSVDHDAAKVSIFFEMLFKFCKRLYPNFQIIVLEHANLDSREFQEALIEEPWTDGRALIPQHWVAEEEE